MVEPSKSFDSALTGFEGQFMGLAKAMPAEKYSFAPSAAIFAESQKTDYLSPNNQGVRNFGQMVAHVAQANYFYGGRLSGVKPDVDVKAIGSLTDKDQIVAALEKSFAFVHQAMGTLTTQMHSKVFVATIPGRPWQRASSLTASITTANWRSTCG
jgi:hypothetical protein